MAYHPLTNEDGCATVEDRRARATDLVGKLEPYMDQLNPKERAFVEKMADEAEFVSVKQHLWLRDIYERYS